MEKQWTYEGKTCAGDPAIAIRRGLELGPRDDDWWYQGHPCAAYVAGTQGEGLRCAAIDSFGDLCGPCRMTLKQFLHTVSRGVLDTVVDVATEVNRRRPI